uniref:Major facilitator superfamily (MFS) profile domain-containing protein n=1 Tax=Anopheles atroparvus TaxID=41427 RepID=A0AAG5DB07_ANOAO
MQPLSFPSARNQFVGTFVVNIITLAHGVALGWVSPSLPYLQSPETHLAGGPLTVEQTSWLGSCLCIGGMLGVPLFGWLADRYGKRRALQGIMLPHLGFWLCVIFGKDIYQLCIGRLLAGIGGGGIMRIVPLFVADIADARIRGMLGSLLPICLNLGTVLAFVVGSLMTFGTFPLAVVALPVLFGFAMIFLPETPACLLRALRYERAERSLAFYRGVQGHFQKSASFCTEFLQLKDAVQRATFAPDAALSWKDFTTKPARRGLAMALFLILLNQCSGTLALITYATTIFELASPGAAPSQPPPAVPASLASIVLATVQLLGTIVSLALVDRIGRKFLLIVSSLGVALGYLTLAVYVQVLLPRYDTTAASDGSGTFPHWLADLLPIGSLSFSILLASVGLLTVPFIVMAEMLPSKIRDAGSTICVTAVAFCAFVLLKIFPVLLDTIGLPGLMGGLATICLTGTLVVVFWLPETKGKSLVDAPETEPPTVNGGNGGV